MSLSDFLHTVEWFQVLLYNSHNSKSIICLHTVYSIWPIDRTLSGTTTPSLSGTGSNGNEGVLPIPQISKAAASPLDCLMLCPVHSLEVGVLPLCRDAVSVFYSPRQLGFLKLMACCLIISQTIVNTLYVFLSMQWFEMEWKKKK